jgi:hypothetical protein
VGVGIGPDGGIEPLRRALEAATASGGLEVRDRAGEHKRCPQHLEVILRIDHAPDGRLSVDGGCVTWRWTDQAALRARGWQGASYPDGHDWEIDLGDRSSLTIFPGRPPGRPGRDRRAGRNGADAVLPTQRAINSSVGERSDALAATCVCDRNSFTTKQLLRTCFNVFERLDAEAQPTGAGWPRGLVRVRHAATAGPWLVARSTGCGCPCRGEALSLSSS